MPTHHAKGKEHRKVTIGLWSQQCSKIVELSLNDTTRCIVSIVNKIIETGKHRWQAFTTSDSKGHSRAVGRYLEVYGEALGVGEAHNSLGGSGGISPQQNFEFYIV